MVPALFPTPAPASPARSPGYGSTRPRPPVQLAAGRRSWRHTVRRRTQLVGGDQMTERISALLCIGCGRIDLLEPCVGACDERVIDLVLAKDCDEAEAQVAKAAQH